MTNEVKELLKKAQNEEEFRAIVEEYGLTENEINELINTELSEDDLDDVAGGFIYRAPIQSSRTKYYL